MADRDSSSSGRENVNPNVPIPSENSNSSAASIVGGIPPAIVSGSGALIGPIVPPQASFAPAGLPRVLVPGISA